MWSGPLSARRQWREEHAGCFNGTEYCITALSCVAPEERGVLLQPSRRGTAGSCKWDRLPCLRDPSVTSFERRITQELAACCALIVRAGAEGSEASAEGEPRPPRGSRVRLQNRGGWFLVTPNRQSLTAQLNTRTAGVQNKAPTPLMTSDLSLGLGVFSRVAVII